MEVPFIKMHGLGNNYIYVDLFQFSLEENSLSDMARKVSDVHTGIGSDGLILIHPSSVADCGMRIFNKDGSEGQSCGNGLRCTAKYAYESGIVTERAFTIETRAGVVAAEVTESDGIADTITINMGPPQLNRASIPMLGADDEKVVSEAFHIDGFTLHVTALSMGNPHAVFLVDHIEEAPLYELGGRIEKDPRFPEGANVEFIEVISDQELHFRVWERGSGVTKACGTGACASVVAAALNGRLQRGKWITVHLEGGDLYIKWNLDGNVWMKGDAEIVAKGCYYYESV